MGFDFKVFSFYGEMKPTIEILTQKYFSFSFCKMFETLIKN